VEGEGDELQAGVCFEPQLANKPKATGEPSAHPSTALQLWSLVDIYTSAWVANAL